MASIESLFAHWNSLEDLRAKDRLLAKLLDGTADGEPPHYCTDLAKAQEAMDQAWAFVEEAAPIRVSCHIRGNAQGGGQNCHVEWWPDDDTHLVTPTFSTEAESRAFAAFVFASLEADRNYP
ncbi:MAG: hypothetical protein HQL52_06095 [Magnetococcales bacterium]|nr:hypothetical protein [Magnetococcales bacterium]